MGEAALAQPVAEIAELRAKCDELELKVLEARAEGAAAAPAESQDETAGREAATEWADVQQLELAALQAKLAQKIAKLVADGSDDEALTDSDEVGAEAGTEARPAVEALGSKLPEESDESHSSVAETDPGAAVARNKFLEEDRRHRAAAQALAVERRRRTEELELEREEVERARIAAATAAAVQSLAAASSAALPLEPGPAAGSGEPVAVVEAEDAAADTKAQQPEPEPEPEPDAGEPAFALPPEPEGFQFERAYSPLQQEGVAAVTEPVPAAPEATPKAAADAVPEAAAEAAVELAAEAAAEAVAEAAVGAAVESAAEAARGAAREAAREAVPEAVAEARKQKADAVDAKQKAAADKQEEQAARAAFAAGMASRRPGSNKADEVYSIIAAAKSGSSAVFE